MHGHLTGSARRRRSGPAGSGGFTYLGVLAVTAIMGITLAGTGEVWHIKQKREKERELLFMGDQFRKAFSEYYENTPPWGRHHPSSLEELVKDPRYPSTRRYLRRVYRDPVTGDTTWGLVKGPEGEIYGVHSLSREEPLKKSEFSPDDRNFEGKTKYADWVFMFVPPRVSSRPGLQPEL